MTRSPLAPLAPRIPGALHHVAALGWKELRQLRRSPRELLLVALAPPLLTLLFGYAFEVGDVKGVPVGVVDDDRSALSSRLVAAMERDATLKVTRVALTENEAVDALCSDRFVAVVRFPPGLAAAARASGGSVHVAVSGIDPDTGPSAIRAMTALLAAEGLRLTGTRLARLGLDGGELGALVPLRGEYDVLFNPRFLFIHYVMPGILGLVLQLVTMGILAGSVTREKELGTLEGLLARPIRPLAILAGKAVPHAAIAVAEVALVLGIARLAFGVSLGPRALPAAVVTCAFVLATIAVATLISSVSRTQAQSLQWTISYTLPAFMLSGALAPTAVMPAPVRAIGTLFPLSAYCHAFRDVSLKQLPLAHALPDLGALFLHACLAFVAARAAARRWG